MRTREEIKSIAVEEKRIYEKRKQNYYSNPNHWSNNKRRQHGLPPLRGFVKEKYRQQSPPKFNYNFMYSIIEDVIDEVLLNKFKNNEFFNKFVDIKNVTDGDKVDFYV